MALFKKIKQVAFLSGRFTEKLQQHISYREEFMILVVQNGCNGFSKQHFYFADDSGKNMLWNVKHLLFCERFQELQLSLPQFNFTWAGIFRAWLLGSDWLSAEQSLSALGTSEKTRLSVLILTNGKSSVFSL